MGLREEADYDLTSEAMLGRSNKDDENLRVRFELFPHMDSAESAKQGRPIFRDREYITIIVPGDKDSIVHRPVWEADLRRFPRQYAQFKNGKQQAQEGTPLEMWPVLTRAQVEEMKYFNISTVEQLATLADTHATKFQGIHALRQKARDFIAAAQDSAHLTKMRAELEERDAKLASLASTMEAMQKRLAELEEEDE